MAVAVACAGVTDAELQPLGGLLVSQIGAGVHTHLGPCPIEIVVLTYAMARVLNLCKADGEEGQLFDLAPLPLVAFLLLSRSGAPAMPGHGGGNGGVVTATGIPQCVRGLYHSCGCFLVASTFRFSHGRQ
jgi:hypothetical protein